MRRWRCAGALGESFRIFDSGVAIEEVAVTTATERPITYQYMLIRF
jgi:hypothetical protein